MTYGVNQLITVSRIELDLLDTTRSATLKSNRHLGLSVERLVMRSTETAIRVNLRKLRRVFEILQRYLDWLVHKPSDLQFVCFLIDIWYATMVAHTSICISEERLQHTRRLRTNATGCR